MTSLSQIVVKSLASNQSMKRRLADAEAGQAKAQKDLQELQSAVQAMGNSLGVDAALTAVTDAADRTETLSVALGDLRHRAERAEADVASMWRALGLSRDATKKDIQARVAVINNQSRALETVRHLFRPRMKSVEKFAAYINSHADDGDQLRRYLSLPAEPKSD